MSYQPRADETREEIMKSFRKPKNTRETIYQARFYANVFGGLILATAGTVAAIRYTMFPEYISPGWEAASWAFASVMSLPFQLYAIPMGMGLGAMSGTQLAESRAKKRKLETELIAS